MVSMFPFFKFLLALPLASLVQGHHLVANFYIDGVDQGAGTCLRVPPTTNPLTDISSSTIVCNVGGEKAVDITCAANAGSEITVQWRTWPDGTQDVPIDSSHQGPCSVYMKKIDQNQQSLAGAGWFKIFHDGVSNGKFCTDRLRANGNKMTFRIPKDLAGGFYALRFEHIALHQASAVNGAQFYVGCAQIFLRSTGGSREPSNGETVRIPGHANARDPGILYDYWTRGADASYKVPGPAPYVQTNSGGGGPIMVPFDPHPKYKECLVKNANWCAVSIPSFKDEDTCYKSNARCWSQLDQCYKSAPPTGYRGCTDYERICTRNNDHCKRCGASRNCNGSFPSSGAKKVRRTYGHTWHLKRHYRPRWTRN